MVANFDDDDDDDGDALSVNDDDDDDDDLKAESWVQRRAGAAVGLRQRRQPHLCGSRQLGAGIVGAGLGGGRVDMRVGDR